MNFIVCSLTNLELSAGVFLEFGFQVFEIEGTSIVFSDDNDVHVVLPPRQDVGMVLERTYEDDRPRSSTAQAIQAMAAA